MSFWHIDHLLFEPFKSRLIFLLRPFKKLYERPANNQIFRFSKFVFRIHTASKKKITNPLAFLTSLTSSADCWFLISALCVMRSRAPVNSWTLSCNRFSLTVTSFVSSLPSSTDGNSASVEAPTPLACFVKWLTFQSNQFSYLHSHRTYRCSLYSRSIWLLLRLMCRTFFFQDVHLSSESRTFFSHSHQLLL